MLVARGAISIRYLPIHAELQLRISLREHTHQTTPPYYLSCGQQSSPHLNLRQASLSFSSQTAHVQHLAAQAKIDGTHAEFSKLCCSQTSYTQHLRARAKLGGSRAKSSIFAVIRRLLSILFAEIFRRGGCGPLFLSSANLVGLLPLLPNNSCLGQMKTRCTQKVEVCV